MNNEEKNQEVSSEFVKAVHEKASEIMALIEDQSENKGVLIIAFERGAETTCNVAAYKGNVALASNVIAMNISRNEGLKRILTSAVMATMFGEICAGDDSSEEDSEGCEGCENCKGCDDDDDDDAPLQGW